MTPVTVATAWVDLAALALSAGGLVVLLLAGMAQRSWRAGVEMALSLWMAAILLRLSGLHSWQNLAAAAVVLLIRYMVSIALHFRRPPHKGQR